MRHWRRLRPASTFLTTVWLLSAAAAILAGTVGYGYFEAISRPLVRRATIRLAGWPDGVRPVTVALISDLHVQPPDMKPKRVASIVEQIDSLSPDVILLAGDFLGSGPLATNPAQGIKSLAPLRGLRARFGTFAVLGNHDGEGREVTRALTSAGITVLRNEAASAGPLVVGGVDDVLSQRDNLPLTLSKMRRLSGAKVLLAHSPDFFAQLPKDIGLTLAGHTHCGQVVIPLVGPIFTGSDYGRRFYCGVTQENGRTLIVTAGVGTSFLPIRIGAAPDMWLIRIGPAPR